MLETEFNFSYGKAETATKVDKTIFGDLENALKIMTGLKANEKKEAKIKL